VAETALLAVSAMVVVTALLGMAAMIFSGLNERRREMAIFRAMGARPMVITGLLMLEALIMALLGAALGVALLYLALTLAQPVLDAEYGIFLPISALSGREWQLLGAVVLAACLASVIPAWRAYRLSLADGMTVRN